MLKDEESQLFDGYTYNFCYRRFLFRMFLKLHLHVSHPLCLQLYRRQALSSNVLWKVNKLYNNWTFSIINHISPLVVGMTPGHLLT